MPRKPKDAAQADAEKTAASMAAVNEKVAKEVAKRKRTVRNFSAAPFEEPLAFAKQVFEFGSGESVRRLRFFDHISKAPDSGASRMLVTNANTASSKAITLRKSWK